MGFLSGALNLASDIFGGFQKNNALNRGLSQQVNGINQAKSAITGGEQQSEGTLRQGQTEGMNAQRGALDTITQNNQPYQTAGQGALMSLGSMGPNTMGSANLKSTSFNFDPSKVTEDPGTKFIMDQAIQSLNRSAAGRGAAGSGGTFKDAAQYMTGLGSTLYGQAYNREFNNALTNYQTGNEQAQEQYGAANQQNVEQFNAGEANRNRLFSLGQMGLAATGNTNAATGNFGNQVMGLDERTGQTIAGGQRQTAGDMANLSLSEANDRYNQTIGKVNNVNGTVSNVMYGLGQMGFPLSSPGRRAPANASAGGTYDPTMIPNTGNA